MNQQEELRALYQPRKKPEAKWLELPMATEPRQEFKFNRFKGKKWPGFDLHINYDVVSGEHAGIVPIWLWRYYEANPSKGCLLVRESALIYALKKQCIGECELHITLAEGGYYPLTIYG